MNSAGLTPDEIRKQHAAEIAESKTFETHGVSKETAIDYLKSPEGRLFRQRLIEASPSAPASKINERAIEQITSGRELPRMEVINEPLVKLTRLGDPVSPYSPYFTKESAVNEALSSGRSLNEHFGLPIRSEGPRYRMDVIEPLAPTEVFVSHVAPTSELGQITRAGGGEQYLVPNRALFTAPTHLRDIDNSLTMQAERGLSPTMARGLGAFGAAAVAVDAASTARSASDLFHAGNQVGGQSAIVHFAGRNLGMVAGAEVIGGGAALAGVESGPGLLVLGAAGGLVGAFGGEKIANAIDNHRIYNQDDRQGQSWHFDPQQPKQGWTRTITTNEIDPQGFPNLETGVPAYKTRTLTADPALTNALNYKASSTAVDLALAHPDTPKDPYSQPAGPGDAHSPGAAPWARDPQTQTWSRHVTDQVLEHGIIIAHNETASPTRAAQLNHAADQTMAGNLAQSPRGMAQQYQSAYEQYGWQQQGPMPAAVSTALKTPDNILQASNGHTYTRGADGQWNTPGMIYGTNAAEGNARNELDATRRTEQASRAASPSMLQHSTTTPTSPAHASRSATEKTAAEQGASAVRTPSPAFLDLSAKLDRIGTAMDTGDWSAVRKDADAFNNTPAGRALTAQAKATVDQEEQRTGPRQPRDPRESGHPDHALNQDIRQQLRALHADAGIYPHNSLIDPLTAAVALNARENRMTRVDQLQFSADKSNIVATQGQGVMATHSFTAVQPALQTPPEQSYQQMAQVIQTQQIDQQRQQPIAQTQQQGPSMGR